ncbi:MAG: tryptophan--tRNA ligase [Acidobacteria bacterium]|nr:tryptophan--tRNA ligase [Acidobacteriota bacterium]
MRVLSGIQPSGAIHLGNYLGALTNWVRNQSESSFYAVVDLHSLTLDIDPEELRKNTRELVATLFAVGLDPAVATVFVQSHVAPHAQLSWLLECTASYGELTRMTQFKEKAERQGSYRVGLLTYPVLMAADILLYQTTHVPVGDDQRQHLELARNLAERFNNRFGQTFTIPEGIVPAVGARVMDLQDPTRKMSKSLHSPTGTLNIYDSPEDIERKIKRAVTDNDGDVAFDWTRKPGLSNLLEIFSSITDREPAQIAAGYTRYGDLKSDLATALIETLRPIRERFETLMADQAELDRLVSLGDNRARPVAEATYSLAASRMGLVS